MSNVFDLKNPKVEAWLQERKRLAAEGFEEVTENGGLLWQLHRGHRWQHRIVDVCIDPFGKTVWIKTAPEASTNA